MSKKGGKTKGKDDGGENNESKIMMLDFRVKQFQLKIVDEQERADRAKTSETQLRQEMFELDKDFKVEKDKLFTISNDMNRQYKQMHDELLKDINELKKTVVEKDDIIKQKELNINDHVKDYESKLKKKDTDIADFKRKIEDMSNEFASMLRSAKETLDKMQERIELAQWDNDSDPQIMKRLKDIAGLQQ